MFYNNNNNYFNNINYIGLYTFISILSYLTYVLGGNICLLKIFCNTIIHYIKTS